MSAVDKTVPEPVITIRGLTKSFGCQQVLSGIDLDIHIWWSHGDYGRQRLAAERLDGVSLRLQKVVAQAQTQGDKQVAIRREQVDEMLA